MEIFDYENVLLLPRKCRVESRSECDTSAELGGRSFKLPVVPANMKTVVDEPITQWLAANGYFYVMHRFDLDNIAYAKRMRDKEQAHLTDGAYAEAVRLIEKHRSSLDRLSQALLEKETLMREEVLLLLTDVEPESRASETVGTPRVVVPLPAEA